MSAFMFVLSDKAIKAMNEKDLEDSIHRIEKDLDGLDWSQFEMCSFKWDKASGDQASLIKLKAELENRKNGTDEPLPRILVPGFNPGDGN